jgi:hypothetical protein
MSNALKIAKNLEGFAFGYGVPNSFVSAANELRRLDALNAELVDALKELADEEWRDDSDPILNNARHKARAALAKAKEQS